jgi:uncharacterized membrane protein
MRDENTMAADGSDSPAPGTPAPEPAAVTDPQDEPTDRLVTLSDGVVAIALTLIILGIQVPSTDGLRDPNSVSVLADALSKTVDGWISYAISFYVIAQFWLIHRQVFRGIRGHREGLAVWNFLFLFTISVMPFTSDLVGKWSENPLSVMIFSLNLILANVAMYGMLTFSRRHRLLNERGVAVLQRYESVEGWISVSFYLLAIPVSLVSPDVAKLCWAGLAIAPRLASMITKRRGNQPAA